jgi:hypothetical protein
MPLFSSPFPLKFLGGSWADRTHDKKEREEGNEPFWVLRVNWPKKGKKACSSGGWLAIKK